MGTIFDALRRQVNAPKPEPGSEHAYDRGRRVGAATRTEFAETLARQAESMHDAEDPNVRSYWLGVQAGLDEA